MGGGRELKSPAAQALRKAGYVPLPRWWVTQDQLDVIRRMAEGNSDVVNAIRTKANRRAGKLKEEWEEEWEENQRDG